MKNALKRGLLIGVIVSSLLFFVSNQSMANKGISKFEWTEASPESQGMSAKKLEEMCLLLERKRTDALLVIRNDQIVLEWYAKGWDRTKKHYIASLAKVLAGGMSLLVTLNDERMEIDDPVSKYISQWRNNTLKSKITIRMLATHSSGIENAQQDGIPNSKLPGWKSQFWNRDPDPFSVARDSAPVLFEPGTSYAYSAPGYALLGYAITASLKDSPQTDIYTLLKERIMDPIGVPVSEWSISYGNKSYNIDDMKLYAIWGGGNYSIDAVARIGRLMLQKGNWEGKKLFAPALVEKMVSYAGTPLPDRSRNNSRPALGLCWYTNFDGVWAFIPKDAFVGAGAGHQVLLVVPSLDLIVVRFGSSLDKENGFWGLFKKYVFNPIIGSKGKHSFWGDVEEYVYTPIMTTIER